MRWRTVARVRSGLAALSALLIVSCGGGGTGDSGTIRIGLTDLPSEAYSSVTITVKQVNVGSNEDVYNALTLSDPVTVNVLDYKDHSLRLGEGSVPATSYNQLRLVLVDNPDTGDPLNYVMLNCENLPDEENCDPEMKWPLKTPSGQSSGMKVSLPADLDLGDGEVVLLTIDFDPGKAIVERGDWRPLRHEAKERFLVKPTGISVVQEVVDDTYGILIGSVAFADAPASGRMAVVTALDPVTLAPVAATVVRPGETADEFRFFLDAGDYDLAIKATGYTPVEDGPYTVTEANAAPRPETDAGDFVLDPLEL